METKNFDTLPKALKYIELGIDGLYGNKGFTYNDYTKYDREMIVKMNKECRGYNWKAYIVVRKTGTQFRKFSEQEAQEEAKKWYNAEFIIGVSKHYNEARRYQVERIELEK